MNTNVNAVTRNNRNWLYVLTGVIVALIIGVLLYIAVPGKRIVKEADQSQALTTLVVSKDAKDLKVLSVADGRLVEQCEPQSGNCRAKIGPADSKGEPTLISADPDNPLENVTRRGPVWVFSYGHNSCQGHLNGGAHYEQCNGCSGPGC